MNLKQFAETYFELEEKALGIMKIYGLEYYDLANIEVEKHEGKLLLNIKALLYYDGGGMDSVWLTFNLEEMDNDLEYFKQKRHKELLKKEQDKIDQLKAQALVEKVEKDRRDRAEFERLKKKFEE